MNKNKMVHCIVLTGFLYRVRYEHSKNMNGTELLCKQDRPIYEYKDSLCVVLPKIIVGAL